MLKIKIFTAGGTIDKVYFDARSSYEVGPPYIAKILSIQKKQGLSHYYLGLYYSKINNPPAAIIHLKKALDTLKDKSDIKKAEILLRKLEKPGTGNNVSCGSVYFHNCA